MHTFILPVVAASSKHTPGTPTKGAQSRRGSRSAKLKTKSTTAGRTVSTASDGGVKASSWEKVGNAPRVYRITYLDLTPRVCSVGTSLASQSPHLGTASLYYLADLSNCSLFSPLSWHVRSSLPYSFVSGFVCVYSERGTASEPGAVAGFSGCW